MESEESLPVILVSAADATTANEFISELIGEEEVAAVDGGGGAPQQGCCALRMWQLRNKYYHARVVLAASPDALPPPRALLPRLDAHLVLLAGHETESGAWLERRVAALAGSGAARVRLALAQCADERGGWAAAARARRYEPVPLRAPAPPSDAEAEEGPRGVQRAREALHAHAWRSLRLHGDAPLTGSPAELSDSLSSEEEPEGEEEEWCEWQSAEMTRRRADQFAAALGALAGGGGGGGGRQGERDARLLRAEALLSALSGPARPAPPAPPAPPH